MWLDWRRRRRCGARLVRCGAARRQRRLGQGAARAPKRRVAELQAQQEELQTRRASVTEEERRRLSLIQDQQRLKEIEQELQREELQREVLRDKSSRKNGTARRLSILGRLAMLTSRRGSTKRDARVTM